MDLQPCTLYQNPSFFQWNKAQNHLWVGGKTQSINYPSKGAVTPLSLKVTFSCFVCLYILEIDCDWPGTPSIAQADLKLIIILSQPLKCWDYSHVLAKNKSNSCNKHKRTTHLLIKTEYFQMCLCFMLGEIWKGNGKTVGNVQNTLEIFI